MPYCLTFDLVSDSRMLRQQVEARGFDDLDLGPDEHHLMLTDQELLSKQQKEINRLREDLSQALTDVETLKLRVSSPLTLSMAYTVYGLHCQWLTPPMAYTVYGLHCQWLTPSMAYTVYGLHRLWLAPSMACTVYGLHCLWLALSMAYTVYGLHSLWLILSMAYTVTYTVWDCYTAASWSLIVSAHHTFTSKLVIFLHQSKQL